METGRYSCRIWLEDLRKRGTIMSSTIEGGSNSHILNLKATKAQHFITHFLHTSSKIIQQKDLVFVGSIDN